MKILLGVKSNINNAKASNATAIVEAIGELPSRRERVL